MVKGKKIVKKKKWVSLIASDIFNKQVIGETLVEEPEHAVGRHVVASLATLGVDTQRQNVQVELVLTKVDQNNVVAEPVGYFITPNSARKLVRRGRTKIDDSFAVKTQDQKIVRLKPLLLTRTRTSGKTRALLIKATRAFLNKEVAKKNYDELFKQLVVHSFQRSLQEHLKKIFPMSVSEIRMMRLEQAAA